MSSRRPVPVIAVSGYLGAGKTTLLNHLLRTPGASLGVIINDFGDINVDAALVAGEVDEPVGISGGCLCCLPDAGGIDASLARLVRARADLDAIIIEASGVAEPENLARLLRSSASRSTRFAGLIEVVDALHESTTIDAGSEPPARYAAATLVAVTQTEHLEPADRDAEMARVRERVAARNRRAHVVEAPGGRLDPLLVLDVAQRPTPPGELPLAELVREARAEQHEHHGGHHHDHVHARSAGVPAGAPVDAGRLADLLETPPASAYRLKGTVDVAGPEAGEHRVRRYVINAVAGRVHLTAEPAASPVSDPPTGLVAIGTALADDVEDRLADALAPAAAPSAAAGTARLERLRRRSA
ncbi:CobW family GTP-binding protein [Actinomyces radicidentis]|uniref:CobW family GTP-binding protein n=1 Tax=Actinomyces radicidentis TaxID=111015 RepID=UPI0026DF94E2|nr:GTP-binding protein [Actinomyces radicidentis]